MFDVRCKQECVSGGLRHTDKCPYDNYRKKGADKTASPKIPTGYQGSFLNDADGKPVMVMASRTVEISEKPKRGVTPKGEKAMAKNTNAPAPANNGGGKNGGGFKPTFRKYADMTDDQKECFRQGAKMHENKIKDRLGMLPPKKG